ncbi:GNAT family protein [Paenibacillus dokdonensis]|uniref:GNAT family protein n=1 Tax=Paenibacillus dokdonensis TaxID=2567944 RepID=A0ABU6GKM3_9BACL|nr:GNAT family protein [Paenibacillus dokdonensis]MEC0239954.1 GNAT family protein [Paenibacillus dokdonensis]
MTTELQTERLYLRKMKLSDSPSLFNTWSDPDVTKFMNINCFTDENQAKDMINLLDELSQDNKAIRYSIIEIESNEIIGSCGFNSLDFENEKAEIGFDIGRAFWGRGYAPEAISSLLNYAFSSLKLNRIEAKVEPENVNSIKVLQKLNFTFEGTLRQYERVNGKFIDINIYSKLKTDWNECISPMKGGV